MSKAKKFFKKHSPNWLKQAKRWVSAKVNPIPRRYGLEFLRHYKFLQQSQWWSEERLRDYQLQKLTHLLKHVYENVSYYKRVFDDRGLKPSDFKELDDLSKLPLLTKETITENFQELIARNYLQFKPELLHTSGTTGKPLYFWVDGNSIALETALAWRHWNWAGYHFREKRVQFRQILYFEKKMKSLWIYEPEENNLGFHAFRVDDVTLLKYYRKLESFRPKMIRGYPSYIFLFAKFLNENRINVKAPIQSVITHSEMLYPHQSEVIEKAFRCKVFNWYGCGENVINACECEKQEGLHVNIERGIIEILKNGEPVGPGEVGEVVATGLRNYSMPLIRYCVRDLAAWKTESCSCGRGTPLIKSIKGRESEIIIGKNGRYLFPAGIIDLVEGIHNIKESQLVQESTDNFTIRIVKRPQYQESDTNRLLRNMRSTLWEGVDINLEFVDQIKRSEAGKYRWFISKAPSKILWAKSK